MHYHQRPSTLHAARLRFACTTAPIRGAPLTAPLTHLTMKPANESDRQAIACTHATTVCCCSHRFLLRELQRREQTTYRGEEAWRHVLYGWAVMEYAWRPALGRPCAGALNPQQCNQRLGARACTGYKLQPAWSSAPTTLSYAIQGGQAGRRRPRASLRLTIYRSPD